MRPTPKPSPIERLKAISARLYWCPRCNVPLLEKKCGICKGDAITVRVTPPGDVRPAFTGDLKRLRKALSDYFVDDSCIEKFLPRRKIVLLNKIQYPDAADEVIVDGQVLGHLFYDLLKGRWRFKPLYAGVALILEERLPPFAVVDLPTITRNYEIKRSRIVKGEVVWEKGRFVAVELKNHTMQAVAEVIRGKRLRVVKAWPWRRYLRLRGTPSWVDVVKANAHRIKRLEKESVDFIRKLVSEYRLPLIVSFSGGKDSLVTYRLAVKALGSKPPLLFNDTGLELPETVNYVKRFARCENTHLILADAGDAFWRGLKALGPPARDYRWCCKVSKLTPIAIAIKKKFPQGALSLVGQRKYESALRAVSPRVWRNPWIPGTVSATPIQDWTALDVWLYIMRERLPPNPLYYMGFDRLGCWLCPASEMGEFETVKEVHPELWSVWERFLERFSESRGYPSVWVRLGLWRWLRPPGDIKRLAERLGEVLLYDEKRSVSLTTKREDGEMVVEVPVGLKEVEKRVLSLAPIIKDVDVTVEEGRIRFKGLTNESVARALVLRSLFCVGCKACEAKCPLGAIKVKDYPKVDPIKCNACLTCNSACPLVVFSPRGARRAPKLPRDET